MVNDSSGIVFELFPLAFRVLYGEPFRESFLSERLIRRTVTLSLAGKIYRKFTGEVMFSNEQTWENVDTVKWSDIQHIESPMVEFSRGISTTQDWYDSYLEPIVIISTAAVVIFLFFTIRS
ncbi:MAG: hypothetical protein KGZ58_10590 [Ignavibacteriales bacterium]|nr:hypothetical protein [Ignavibacteriales bacterium]